MPSGVVFSAQAKTASISVTTAASGSAALPALGSSVRLVNEGPNNCYVSIGSGAQTATVPTGTGVATATPVLAGTDVTLSIPSDSVQNISAITSTGTATLRVAVNEGL